MPADEAVLAEGVLERRQPAHQQHGDQHQVGAEQPGEPAERRGHATRERSGRARWTAPGRR